MDRNELNAELLRLLRDLRRLGAQRFLAEVEHLLRRFEPEPERIDGTAWPETIAVHVTMPPPFVVAYAGVAEGMGTAFPATIDATASAALELAATVRATVTTPDRRPAGQVVALVVLVAAVLALLASINTTMSPPEAARANLALVVELLLVLVALPRG